jgi:hypothetical protein
MEIDGAVLDRSGPLKLADDGATHFIRVVLGQAS